MIKILHTGDLHIGSFPGPEKDGENVRFQDICKCLDALVAGAEEQKPDIAVIAGDIFHQARVWSDRGLKEQRTAVRFLRELSEICPVVVMRGTPNHDSEEQFKALASTFEDDPTVHIVTEPGVETYVCNNGEWVEIACLPGFDRGFYRAKYPGLSKEEENQVFTEAIETMIIGLKAQCRADLPSVLVSHFTITGANMESGQTAFFSQFEPVVYPATLAAAGFDLTCFGHIHRPQQLDGCPNTFYCGAISALNFNDEGQRRGFYIHEIFDKPTLDTSVPGPVMGGGPVPIPASKSTFYPLPTREYKTIRLKDDDIREINEVGPGWLYQLPVLESEDEVRDKIVRVLYDCTDEHNKAFNHAALERWLYETAGAFWVQEITPQKITITVDRQGMEAEDTPEENLTAYLLGKDYDAEKAGELVELARPIISEATEKATTERHTGALVPVEIEVHNYRNYQDETFTFDPIRFCTINGSNGVGKSSLFMDAMLDALYEEPREGELTGWIRNDPEARSGAIKFTFRLGDSLYRVTRTRQKSGKATLNISELVDGEWADRSEEKFKDTQQKIINIIGMDSLTLKACALIMQDQYGLFLQADKEARMNILGSILGLGIYADMEELAAARATETNRAIRSLADRAEAMTAGLPDRETLAAKIAEEEEHQKHLEQVVEEKTAVADSLKVKLNTQLEAAGRVLRLNGKLTDLTGQKATKEAAKTAQVGIITAAETVLAGEAEVKAGVAALAALLDREKELIKGKAVYDNLAAQRRKLTEDAAHGEQAVADLRTKMAVVASRVKHGKEDMARMEALAGKHTEYEETAVRLTEMEALAPEYAQKTAEVTRWADELKRLDADYAAARTRITLRIDGLKSKVALLENSGCPDVENATCRFLADAKAAREALPTEERILADLDKEYEEGRDKAHSALSAAETALAGFAYQPEAVAALRAALRGLEAAEKEYQGAGAKRSELKANEERLAELEKDVEEAEAGAAKTREALAETEAKLATYAAASADYDGLQAEIAAARIWPEKEKQLPVAREQKAAAAQRVMELTSEVEAIEREITETREELALEQSKTVGTEELQRQVDEAEGEVKTYRGMAQCAASALGGYRAQMEAVEKKVAEAADLQGQMNDLGGKAAGYEELKRAFSQDGIPHNIIRSIIPIFEATATNILGQMSGGHMSVEFVTEKVLKSNSKKEVTTLDIIINDSATGRLPYMSRSGGERVKAALSVILALSEIKSSKAGVQLGFLFIDEPPFLDADGTQAYCGALETIQRRYPDTKIMAITHDETFKARFPQSVTVYKDEAGSHVRGD